MENLIYFGLVIGLLGLGTGAVYLKRKLNISEKEMELAYMVLEVVDFITSQFEFKYKEDVSLVVEYVFMAKDFVEEYEGLEGDYRVKIELIQDKALDLLDKNGVAIDDGTDEIVERIVEFIYGQYLVSKQ